MSNTDSTTPIVRRIRYPFRSRHVQLLARESISPGFIRLTLGGPELDDFLSSGFDDHVKLILPQSGLAKPNLPVMIDGRPYIEGERPTMRDYTPLCFDPANNTIQMEFALHGAGPAADWASTAPIGQWLGIAGPRGSLLIPTNLQWHWLFGDESAMPAIERRLAELPAGVQAVVRLKVSNPADRRAWRSAADLDLQWVGSLSKAVQSMEIPCGNGFIWAAGEHRSMAELRKLVLAKPGAKLESTCIASYWKQGEADHRKDLTNA